MDGARADTHDLQAGHPGVRLLNLQQPCQYKLRLQLSVAKPPDPPCTALCPLLLASLG